jgi:hypothetical protein
MRIKTWVKAGTLENSPNNEGNYHASSPHQHHGLATILAPLSLLLAWLGSSVPAHGGPATTLVTVRNRWSLPVSGAMVYKGCNWQGNTNARGQITLSGVLPGEHLQVRKLVYIGSTDKGAHNGWSYHVWQTNIVQKDDGSQVDHVVSNPASPQTIVVSPHNAQIGFNLVVSVQFNATPEYLNEIRQQLMDASEFLFDVSDGQMFFENAVIYKMNCTGRMLTYGTLLKYIPALLWAVDQTSAQQALPTR